jgi:hypothetical protein
MPEPTTALQATPRPWKLLNPRTSAIYATNIHGLVHVATVEVAPIQQHDESADRADDETAANAELIVRAVNSHEQLVAALEALTKWLTKDPEYIESIAERVTENGWNSRDVENLLVEQAEAALTAAKGGR